MPHMDNEPDRGASVAQSDEEKLSLISLPLEIKRYILKYLLQAERVYMSTFPDITRKSYCFETAISRTSKSFKELGTDIFNHNNFILVSTNDNMYGEMLSYDVCPWKNGISYFPKYHLRLHIHVPGVPPPKKHVFYLLT